MSVHFASREVAGRRFAETLSKCKGRNPRVLAMPGGAAGTAALIAFAP